MKDELALYSDTVSISGSKARLRKFAESWPHSRRGLELMQTVVRNIVLKQILQVVIQLGDILDNRFQKQQQEAERSGLKATRRNKW